jgi:HicB_like antitoxin of bacterial toxin-antitoxin system
MSRHGPETKDFQRSHFVHPPVIGRLRASLAMTTTTSGNTVYNNPVAKVMISIPDDLLGRLDTQARANRETRSGFLRRLAERELDAARAAEREEIESLLDKATVRGGMGGDAARLIREDRESR